MALDLINYERKTREAVDLFWANRESARQCQTTSGRGDKGERSGVTAGKNMNGFHALLSELVCANGLDRASIFEKRAVLTLPGYFRPTKIWDMLVVYKGCLVAAIELKSHVGPSFGNNFNNRAEESIGSALDFWTAYRENAFGPQPRPFLGWMMLVEDAPRSRAPVTKVSSHFPVLGEFEGASYIKRYDLLCQRLVQEGLYSAAALVTTPRAPSRSAEIDSELSPVSGMKTFVTALAGHVAAEAARLG